DPASGDATPAPAAGPPVCARACPLVFPFLSTVLLRPSACRRGGASLVRIGHNSRSRPAVKCTLPSLPAPPAVPRGTNGSSAPGSRVREGRQAVAKRGEGGPPKSGVRTGGGSLVRNLPRTIHKVPVQGAMR